MASLFFYDLLTDDFQLICQPMPHIVVLDLVLKLLQTVLVNLTEVLVCIHADRTALLRVKERLVYDLIDGDVRLSTHFRLGRGALGPHHAFLFHINQGLHALDLLQHLHIVFDCGRVEVGAAANHVELRVLILDGPVDLVGDRQPVDVARWRTPIRRNVEYMRWVLGTQLSGGRYCMWRASELWFEVIIT